jgi:gamma-glutamylcyclotransferase (GGCT)/AIG2-like uncharacterized protein YtfP
MEKLFVYGTLQEPEVQLRLIGRFLEGHPDTLSGYERNSKLLAPYPVAMPNNHAEIHGHVLEVTSAELAQFDIYETEDYQRIPITLASGTEAWVYIGNPARFG